MNKISVNRHELAYYFLFATLALLGLSLTAVVIWYAIPREPPTPSPIVTVGRVTDFPPSSEPYLTLAEHTYVWLVNTGDEIIAYDRQTPFDFRPYGRCSYAWVSANQRFEDPCSGVKFGVDGQMIHEPYIQIPAPRNLDQFPVTIEDDHIFIHLSTPILGDPVSVPDAP